MRNAAAAAQRRQGWTGGLSLGLLALGLAFPIALMVFNPTLMFARGWEQYAGTSFYFLAIFILGREVFRMRGEEQAFAHAQRWLGEPESIDDEDGRLLPRRIRGLVSGKLNIAQMVELNREASALDQEHAASRFTLTRYILYLLPVIGFIGTVEGISKALLNISKVLPMVKELDGFLTNLTSVTDSLNIAFDSTLLALFLSAVLMLVQTVVTRRCDDLLLRVDRWVVEHVLPLATREEESSERQEALTAQLERVEAVLSNLMDQVGPPVDRFAGAVDRLPIALAGLERGVTAIGQLGDDLSDLGQTGDAVRKGLVSLTRIEASVVAAASESRVDLLPIQRGLDRTCTAVEGMSGQLADTFERSNRATQEQLARTLASLKDALDMLNVSMEQGNALYRSIVKKMLPGSYVAGSDERAA